MLDPFELLNTMMQQMVKPLATITIAVTLITGAYTVMYVLYAYGTYGRVYGLATVHDDGPELRMVERTSTRQEEAVPAEAVCDHCAIPYSMEPDLAYCPKCGAPREPSRMRI